MSERIDLQVHYLEKDEAKSLGARWDPLRKTWYVPAGVDAEPFIRWVREDDLEAETLDSPVFVLESSRSCWKCGRTVRVAAVAAECECEDECGKAIVVWMTYSDLQSLSSRLLASIRRVNPGFKKNYSKMAGCEYFMNHCPCGAHQGDFFLHSEPGGAFLPLDAEAAASVTVRELPEGSGPHRIAAKSVSTVSSLIEDYAAWQSCDE